MAAFREEYSAAKTREFTPLLGPNGLVDREAHAVYGSEPTFFGGFDGGPHAGMIAPLIAHLDRSLARGRLGQHGSQCGQVSSGRLVEVNELAGAHTLLRVRQIASG